MNLLRAPKNAVKKKKIVGRGQGSGSGTTSGRGTKGQNSRSGGGTRPGFEGGQMPLYRRIARRGFKNGRFKKEWLIVNIGDLKDKYKAGETVNRETLLEKKIIKKKNLPIKLLGNGEIDKKLNFDLDKVSAGAMAKLEKAGGTVQKK